MWWGLGAVLKSCMSESKQKRRETLYAIVRRAENPLTLPRIMWIYENRPFFFYANFNRHALRPNKNIGIWCKPQSTRFETQQKYWNTCPRKLKFRFLIENPDPTFIIKTWTKGISITPWPSDYNWITNQRYKVWTPQERISDKFTVLEEPKEEQSLTFFYFYSIVLSITMSTCYL